MPNRKSHPSRTRRMHVRTAAFVLAVGALAAAYPARAEIPLDLTPEELD